jgi:hypothetical protein
LFPYRAQLIAGWKNNPMVVKTLLAHNSHWIEDDFQRVDPIIQQEW